MPPSKGTRLRNQILHKVNRGPLFAFPYLSRRVIENETTYLVENTCFLGVDALIVALLLLDATPQLTQSAQLSESSSLEKLGMPVDLSRLSAAFSSLRDPIVGLDRAGTFDRTRWRYSSWHDESS